MKTNPEKRKANDVKALVHVCVCVCVCFYLRNGQASNCEAGNNIRFEEFKAVIRTPLKNREYILSCKNPFLLQWLPFELAQRVIREEGFFKPGLDFGYGALVGRWHNFVYLHGYF